MEKKEKKRKANTHGGGGSKKGQKSVRTPFTKTNLGRLFIMAISTLKHLQQVVAAGQIRKIFLISCRFRIF